MSPEYIFSVSSGVAMIGWIVLLFFPVWKQRDRFVLSILIVILAIIYAWFIFSNFSFGIFENFNSLEGVSILFADKELLLAGWIHYLAFDLLAGIYIIRNAQKNNINHWITTPALLLTFMLGPVGFLLYFLIRWMKTGKYIADNF